MSQDAIVNGQNAYESVWLKCLVSGSKKPDEVLVKITVQDSVEPPLFYVDVDLVEPKNVSPGPFVDGTVRSSLIETHNGTAIVEVPGEPVSYGPKVFVSKDLVIK